MKVALLVSGYLRGYEQCIPFIQKHLLNKYDVDVYLHITKDEDITDKYDNNTGEEQIKNIISMLKPISVVIEPNRNYDSDPLVNNTINSWAKLYKLNQIRNANCLQGNKYDIVIRYRPDVLFHDESIFDNLEKYSDAVYIPLDSKVDKSKLLKNNDKHICDAFAIGNYMDMDEYFAVYQSLLYLINSHGHVSETILYEFLNFADVNYKLIDIKYSFILSKCSVFAICGDSGSGKTTLSNTLKKCFSNAFTLECDRYHKWERGDDNWNKITHLNPDANYITKMKEDVFNLKCGKEIFQVDYNHSTGKFTDKELISPASNLIVCGLHSLYNDNKMYDIKVFMDTEYSVKRIWKRNRDIKERGYTQEKVDEAISNRENDYHNYIKPQKGLSDLIVQFYYDNDNLKLRLIIGEKFIVSDILDTLRLSDINYTTNFGHDGYFVSFDNYKYFDALDSNGYISHSFYDYIIYFMFNMRKING